jgi:HD-GYP domain-containing protein (c-di-GMP phosphodiesterase class II)
MNLTQYQIQSLEYAASLHDAGKFQISQDLLQKVQPLTCEERELIKNHPKKGADIFKGVDALKPVLPIILYHHEKYDGTGYPKGLKKNQIPAEARILALIDAFDAMYFGRSYRHTASLEDTMNEIKHNSGTQFDPEIVDAFIGILCKPTTKKYLKRKE